ncbi:hypothetical protein FEL34_00635 [Escherichia coli]|nr:hypothetical protein [Escherichia coli]
MSLWRDIATFQHGLGKVYFVHAGCGMNALSGIQNRKISIYYMGYVGLISVAHQEVWRLSSVSDYYSIPESR